MSGPVERDAAAGRSAAHGGRAAPRGAAARALPALFTPSFRTYWFGILAAEGATSIFQVTAAWLVYELTAPPLNVAFMLGVLEFCRTAPMLALILAGGVMADRFGRRRILILTNCASASTLAMFGVVVLAGWVSVWLVLVVALLMGCAIALNRPAHQAFIRDLAPVESLQSAVALASLMQKVARIGVPLTAGVLLATGSASIPLLLAATGAAAMALLLLTIRVPQASSPAAGILTSLGEVLHYIRSDRLVAVLLLLETIPGLFALPYGALLPIFADTVHGRGAAGLGVMNALGALGGLAGALLLTLLSGIRQRGMLLIGAITALGSALAAFALTTHWPLALVMLALVGFCDTLYILTISGLLLGRAPDHLRGRVMSVFTLADIGMTPLGSLMVGGLAAIAGAPAALAASGAVVVTGVAGVATRFPHLRRS